jgi:hypothetical protein
MKYRKKPVVVEAFRLSVDNMPDWFCDAVKRGQIVTLPIPPMEGGENDPFNQRRVSARMKGDRGYNVYAHTGDWIIKGIGGKFHTCLPDIFEQTYEPVTDPEPIEEIMGR